MGHWFVRSQHYLRLIFFASLVLAVVWLFIPQAPISTLQSPSLPASPPDASLGLDIYAERCANCHGPTGYGDGELAANLPQPPPNFTAPAWRRTAIPADLFGTITNGRVQNGMPPFGPNSSDPIPEADRWHLVATVFSLGTNTAILNEGKNLYIDNCQACHGAQGDEIETADLSDLGYWFNQSNEAIFTTLTNATIPEHDYSLSDDELWLVTDYARTFSYFFADPNAPIAPIPAAAIGGTVFNGTTNEIVNSGQALLRAFTADFQEQLSQTAPVAADGRYQFNLTDVPPDWIYFVTVAYKDLNFSSAANRLSRAEPALDMPVVVYEKSSDATNVVIDQVHLIFGFGAENVDVSELYIINNSGTAVFVGESGDPDEGTVEFALPAGAQNVSFRRSFGSVESFAPAEEIITTDQGWADTVPLQPGDGVLTLLVTYQLPYRDGLTIAHPLPYTTNNITAIVPEVGVNLSGERWTSQGAEQLPNGIYTTYAHDAATAGEALTLQLNGRPRLITDAEGNLVTLRNQTAELVIGSTALLVVLVAAAYLLRAWQNPAAALPDNRDSLLRALAQLDDAYEAHQISPGRYNRQRQKLKAKLTSLWQNKA